MKNKIIKIKNFNRLDTAERLVNWERGKKKRSKIKHGETEKKGKERKRKI